MRRAKRIVVIAGPTASGKSASAVKLAQEIGGEVVSADSIQVYRGFDIGSAKPDAQEQQGIPHHMIDVLDPDEDVDAMCYAKQADAVIKQILKRGATPIICGGTGLWIRALVRGLVEAPPVDPQIRAALETEVTRAGSETLHQRLAQVDPLSAQKIHPNDSLRIVRALEVYEQSGRALGEMHREHALGSPRYPNLFIAVERDKEELHARIERRSKSMFERGWVQEAKTLLEKWGPEVRAFQSVGYRELREHLEEATPLEETKEKVLKSTRLYARRQKNWFRAEPGIELRLPADEVLKPTTMKKITSWLDL